VLDFETSSPAAGVFRGNRRKAIEWRTEDGG